MTARGDRDVLPRSIVLPSDLHLEVERVAQAEHYPSVQTFVVAELQRIVNQQRGRAEP